MEEIKRYSIEELEELGEEFSGSSKMVYVVGDYVYKFDLDDYYSEDTANLKNESEKYLKKVLSYRSKEELKEIYPSQLYSELHTWLIIDEKFKRCLCPIVDYYIDKTVGLICVMPNLTTLREEKFLNDYEEIWEYDSTYDEEIESFKKDIVDLERDYGFDSRELGLLFNIGTYQDRIVSIDYGR